MSTLVITTFSEDGYYLYGEKLIETWQQYWPANGYTLRIYAEHDLVVDDPRIEIINLNDVSPKLLAFKKNCNISLESETNKKLIHKIEKTVKWCHKVYAIEHALHSNHDYLIYLDGDTYTINNVHPGALESLSEKCLFSVHFERLKGMAHYETGLLIFNKHHEQIDDLKEHITSAYDTGEIFELPKSWDGFWFAVLHERRGYQVRDLAGGKFRGVFTNPVVKKILVHLAGNDKYEGQGFNTFSGKKILQN
tara:strand:- start:380 stop:1129 length:750 start_codon:yes stop_codon:yes gene_type:complete